MLNKGVEKMADRYLWDIEELLLTYNELNSQLEYLREKKEFLVSLNQEVNTGWQGLAHSEFENQMEVNIDEFNKMISKLSEQLQTLDFVIKECYQPCEDEIGQKLSSLLSKIES